MAAFSPIHTFASNTDSSLSSYYPGFVSAPTDLVAKPSTISYLSPGFIPMNPPTPSTSYDRPQQHHQQQPLLSQPGKLTPLMDPTTSTPISSSAASPHGPSPVPDQDGGSGTPSATGASSTNPAEAEAPNPNAKPTLSYASLIMKAIFSSPARKLTLNSIYLWVQDSYPYFKTAPSGWKNSIRHNLSLNKAFHRVPRDINEPGKGAYWTIDMNYVDESMRPKSRFGRSTSDPHPYFGMPYRNPMNDYMRGTAAPHYVTHHPHHSPHHHGHPHAAHPGFATAAGVVTANNPAMDMSNMYSPYMRINSANTSPTYGANMMIASATAAAAAASPHVASPISHTHSHWAVQNRATMGSFHHSMVSPYSSPSFPSSTQHYLQNPTMSPPTTHSAAVAAASSIAAVSAASMGHHDPMSDPQVHHYDQGHTHNPHHPFSSNMMPKNDYSEQ
ncbi:hypothetical protein H4R33_004934 [Dimargaris cristalligena]|nr:hypothetical protein H4R33_004934 [Dimargaris cristalligena]